MQKRATRRPTDLYTLFEYKGQPFRIDVAWNQHVDEWQWAVSPRGGRVLRLSDEIYSVINPIFRRRRLANMREAVGQAVKEGLWELMGGKKRWGLLYWDGVWYER